MTNEIAGSVIPQRLKKDEKLLWCGRPGKGLRLNRSDRAMIPFSILWAGFAFFWEYMVIHSDAPFFFRLWGIPFVCTGIYMLVGRFFYDAYRRGRTWYGVSDQRAVIVTQSWSVREQSINPAAVAEIEIEETSNGDGCIYFGTRPPMYQLSRGPGRESRTQVAPPAFEWIPDVRQVYELVLKVQMSRKS